MSDPESARHKRLSEALRENLKRRKSQARGRAIVPKAGSETDNDAPETPDDDSRDSSGPQGRAP